MELLTTIIKSKAFKIIAFILSIVFFVSTFFIKIDANIFNTWGLIGVFVFNTFSSGILLIPKLVDVIHPVTFTLVSALGMTVSETLNWYIGYASNDFIKEASWEKKIERVLGYYGLYAIFFFALIPFPFDMIATFSGRLNISFKNFILTILTARIVRFSLIIYAFKVLI